MIRCDKYDSIMRDMDCGKTFAEAIRSALVAEDTNKKQNESVRRFFRANIFIPSNNVWRKEKKEDGMR